MDGEGLFGGACGLEGYAGRSSLPGRRGAGGIGWDLLHIFVGRSFVGDVCDLYGLLENGLAAVDLGDDCVDILPVVGDAAIGGIVAVPTDGGVEDVKVGQIDERDAAGGTIDQEPSTRLPFPVRRGFLGKAVVDAEGPADYEEAIRYVVGGAKCEFLDVSIDEKSADFQSKRLFSGCAGAGLREPLDGGPFAERDDMGFGRGDGARLKQDDDERQQCVEATLPEADHGRG